MSGWTADGAAIGFGDGSDWEFTDDHMAAERIVARHNDALAEAERQRDDALAKIARVEAVCDEYERLGAASLPPGVTLSGCVPALSAIPAYTVRAALADPEPTP